MSGAASLRGRLLRGLVPALVLVWLIGSAFILMRSWDEIEDSYVDQLDHMAFALAQVLDDSALTPEAVVDSVRARRDRNIFVVVFRQGQPVLRSARAPDGISELTGDGDPRYYLARETARGGQITVVAGLERDEVRQLITQVAAGAALPMALGLLAMLGVVLVAITRALRPLDDLRAELEDRHPDQLDPLRGRDLPTELRPVVEALNHLLGRMRLAVDRERRFVADASHELRTPLAAIRAQVDTIDRSRLDAETGAALDQILRGVGRSTRLVQQLLRLARADADDGGAAAEIRLDEQAVAIVSDLFPLAVLHDTDLQLDCAPARVRAMPADIEMVLGNLIENAVHHAGTGARIRVSCGPAGGGDQGGAADGPEDDGGAWLCVEDSGPGIAEPDRAGLFDRFRRGPRSSADGAGLGLAIVASVAQRLGAAITLGRSDGPGGLGGLRVDLRFPPIRPAARFTMLRDEAEEKLKHASLAATR